MPLPVWLLSFTHQSTVVMWILNPISRDNSVFREFWKQAIICCNLMQQFSTYAKANCFQLKVCTVLYIPSQCCATTCDCIYVTSNQSYCLLHYENFICEKRENLHDRFLYNKLLGHWCVWLPENMLYNNKWLRRALPLPLWNGTIHKTLSLCINIYRYKTHIIKKNL